MRLAQQLYEGVELKGQGTVGLITYLRTDSTRVSDEAVTASKDYITKNYGAEYAAEIVTEKKKIKRYKMPMRQSARQTLATRRQVSKNL